MEYYNPDYPVSGGSFAQHTCEALYQCEQPYYYDGNCAVNPFAGNQFVNGVPVDSRRNMVPPTAQQQPPFNGVYNNPGLNGQVQNPPVYPQANETPQLNSFIESRRNTGVPQANPTSYPQNPFGIQPVGTTSTFPSQYYQQPVVGDMSTMALYTNTDFSFDRKGGNVWNNMYTTPQTPPPANIDWGTINNNQQNLNPISQYQMTQFPQTNTSWADIAKDIWK